MRSFQMEKKENIKGNIMKIKAFITKLIYKNTDNDYSIYKVSLENGEEHTITGNLPDLTEDLLYEFDVEEVVHPKFGLQYKVNTFKASTEQNRIGLISYLSSDLFFGVGVVTATKIVDLLGMDAIEKILKDKDVLKQVGFNPLQIERMYQALFHNQETEKLLVELFSYGLSSNLSMKLFNYYGYEAAAVIKENPYRLITEVDGIGFLRADEVAFKVGFKEDDPLRIKAAIEYSIYEYINKTGNTYLSYDMLYQAIRKILNLSKLEQNIEDAIEELIKENTIYFEDDTYTLKTIKDVEFNLAQQLLTFTRKEPLDLDFSDLLKKVEKTVNVDYTKLQKKAITEAMNNQITVITGGPGTGKTTVLLGILRAYALLNGYSIESESIVEHVGVCAPTGRAARRMSEIMGVPSFTIHRLLGYDYEQKFHYNEQNKLPQELFIIDEASMIDIFLAEQLFKAINEDAKIVIVGDKDQLPSVGPGQVLADIIASDTVGVITLDEIHRQSVNSSIIKIANEVNHQSIEMGDFSTTDDLIFYQKQNEEIIELLLDLTNEALKKGYDLIDDLQVLIPMYRGSVGIDATNKAFQLHFQKNNTLYIQRGANRYYTNDKVMHLVNSPDKGVMNGDIGIVKQLYKTSDDKKVLVVKYMDAEVAYVEHELDDLTLAYAVSVHKSQGSEYQMVFMPLVRSHSIMLRKELLYTGITRAKNYLYLIGDLSLILYASKKLNDKRLTKLKQYLNTDQEEEVEEVKTISPYDFMEHKGN